MRDVDRNFFSLAISNKGEGTPGGYWTGPQWGWTGGRQLLGLDGVIVLAFIIAIPANEIVMPTALMLYMNQGRMVELQGAALSAVLTEHGWTLLTAISLMLFSLLHNPCGTTIWTIWKETRSPRWTVFGALMPLGIAIIVCAVVAALARLTVVAGIAQ